MIVVTGSAGFVGGELARRLDRPGKIEAIVSCAAVAHMGRALAEPRRAIERSISATLDVLEHARKSGVPVIHLSTDEQYRADGTSRWGELAPDSPYAAAKIAQEAACRAYRTSYGVAVSILTVDLVVGPGQPADKVVPTLARAIRAGDPVPVVATARRYSTIGNVASLVEHLLTLPEPVDVAMPGTILTAGDLAIIIARALGRAHSVRLDWRDDPGPCRDVRVRDLPGWSPVESFDDGLREALS